MLKRKAMEQLQQWKDTSSHKALLVEGARQIGKTYLIREFGRQNYERVIEINLLETEGAAEAFNTAKNSSDLFSRITLYAEEELVPGKTLIFIDEVQEAPEMITAAKFLIEKTGHEYAYAFSGSLLGIELKNIKSWPVGFMKIITMYPLDFEEFCWAKGLSQSIVSIIKEAAASHQPVDGFVHEKTLDLFYYYLTVGGMPEAVANFADTQNLQLVRDVQADVIQLYRSDIARYCKDDALFVKAIFDTMPSQLNQQNKRFIVSRVNKEARIKRDENKFLWLVDAGVALPAYDVEEPRFPLKLSEKSSFFKLFMSDIGLLAAASGMETVKKTLDRQPTNYGAIYENFVAQELVAHGHKLHYFKNKKLGELDFVMEWPDGTVIPLEVKSGKDYHRHRALKSVLKTSNYHLTSGIVLCDANVSVVEEISYLPIYMAAFL